MTDFSNIRKIPCDGVIFDVDGTLWDCTETAVKAYNDIIHSVLHQDYSLTSDDLKRQFGKPMREIGRNLFSDVTPERSWQLMVQITDREDQLLAQDRPDTYPDVPDTIRSLAKVFPIFIISNCQAGYIERFLQVTDLGSCITDHSCPDDTGRLKADNISLMVAKYHLHHAVYVGDTHGDEIACEKAGVPFIYASYGFGTAEKPAATLTGIADLSAILTKADPES